MIAKIVKVNIKSVDSDNIALGSLVLEDGTSYPIYGEENKLKEYQGITADLNFRIDTINGIKTRVVSFISVASLGAAVKQTTQDDFNILISSATKGSAYLNFDPRNSGNNYTNATFLVLDAVDKTNDWSDLTCIGCSSKFTLRWFHHGIKQDIKAYIGKICMVDINKNSYGFNASGEVQILDIQLFDNNDVNRALQYLKSEISNIPDLQKFTEKINYFTLMNKQEVHNSIIRAALQIFYAKIFCNHFTNVNLNIIISAIVLRSLRVLVTQVDVNPDLALFAKLYLPNWEGQNISMYILSDVNVYKVNLERYIVNLAETFVDKLYAGGTLECASG